MRNYLSKRNNDLGFGFFDEMMDEFFKPVFYGVKETAMKTDIKQTDKGYELSIDMPGFEKNELSLTLNDGYLTVSASKNQTDDGESFIRRERKMSCTRTYFVGKDVSEDDVKAKYQNGTLTLDIPKVQAKEKTVKTITID